MKTRGDRPTVSVVIPCFNQARYLPAAIASVRRQTYQPIECVVVNDGSTDDAGAVASRLADNLIEQPNRGLSEARNAGLAAARGELVIFLDADDELLPDAVARGVRVLTSNPASSAVVGRCQAMNREGHSLPTVHHPVDTSNLYRHWLTTNFVWTPGAAMFRRPVVVQIGGFPAGLGPAADYAVYLELARTGGVAFLDEEIVRYRQHDESMSRDPALMLRTILAVLERERRAAPPWAHAHIRQGRGAWCNWYGEQIVDRLRKDWHAGMRDRARMGTVLTLLRYCPALVLRHAARKGIRLLTTALRLARVQLIDAMSIGRRAAR